MNMTSKELHIAVKKEHGTEYMMSRYNFESEEALFQAIRNVAPMGAAQFINALKKNQKKIDKQRQRKSRNDEKVQAPAGGEEKQNESLIEEMQREEQELSDFLCQLEREHKEMSNKRRKCMARLKNAKKALEELQRILSLQEENVGEIYDEYIELDKQMQENNKMRSESRELLEKIRSQIWYLGSLRKFRYLKILSKKLCPGVISLGISFTYQKIVKYVDVTEKVSRKIKIKKIKKI